MIVWVENLKTRFLVSRLDLCKSYEWIFLCSVFGEIKVVCFLFFFLYNSFEKKTLWFMAIFGYF